MLGLSRDEIINAVSLAWVDGQSLRTYRHTPNTGCVDRQNCASVVAQYATRWNYEGLTRLFKRLLSLSGSTGFTRW
jgi:hypothetical protein